MEEPKYVNKEGLYNKIFSSLDDIDKVAFFTFSIYRWLSDDRRANLDTHPYMKELYDFASQWCADETFMKSLSTYLGEDLRFFGVIKSIKDGLESFHTAGSDQTFAYKTAAKFLHEKFNTPLTTSKTFDNDDTKKVSSCLANSNTSSSVNLNLLQMKNKLKPKHMALLQSEFDKQKKSKLVTYLFWFFTGAFGGHRFYVGDIVKGVFMLITFGGIGIWALIDVFFIGKRIEEKNQILEVEILQKIISLGEIKNDDKSATTIE